MDDGGKEQHGQEEGLSKHCKPPQAVLLALKRLITAGGAAAFDGCKETLCQGETNNSEKKEGRGILSMTTTDAFDCQE